MEDRYRRLFSSGTMGIGFCSADTHWLEVNETLCSELGYRPSDLSGSSWLNVTHPDDIEREMMMLDGIRVGNTDRYTIDKRLVCADGHFIKVTCSVEAVRENGRDITFFILLVMDPRVKKEKMEQLQLAADIVSHATQGIMVTDARAKILEVNDAFVRITGYTRDEVLGKNPSILRSGQQSHQFYTTLWNDLATNGYWAGEIWNRRKDGEDYVEQLSISAIRNQQGKATRYVALFSDVTPQKTFQRQLEHNAYFDALTNLPNRSLMADRLSQAMANAERREQRLAVVFLDLDGFKNVNDEFGHSVGDTLLVAVANRLKMLVREGDTVARLGGDEFVIIAVDLNETDAASYSFLNRILSSVSQPVQVGARVLSVTASLGVVFYPQRNDVSGDMLLRQADQAMYEAKTAGKNRFLIFDTAHDFSRNERQRMIECIRLGLANGEFAVHYQPKVNMRTGQVLGAEALIRWLHPQKGLLLPGEFLPAIEDHPLIADIGEWVINEVLAQLARWHSVGHHYTASVNVSAFHLQQTDFFERLERQLKAYPNVAPDRLELEVLETSALRDMSLIAGVIEQCQAIGIGFALDDFGTGYSTLSYLKHLPAKQLKIDKTFVQGMLFNPDDLAILEGIIGLADAFRRQVIAEGVETLEHGSWLLKLGCDVAQGFGIGKPMAIEQFDAWATSWKSHSEWMKQKRLHRDDIPLLVASVEHRAWIASIDEFVRGRSAILPSLDQRKCRFGHWLHSEAADRFREVPSFNEIESLHEEVHVTVSDLIRQRNNLSRSHVLARLKHLFLLRDRLIQKLLSLLNNGTGTTLAVPHGHSIGN